ncbi:unnamed protein product [Larinioides sclopetarius]|uniref:EAL domain-containing protein n=1 Tax=Larinioides sclopetarius TaxID=280406 RepID=A0AAV1YV99_9ARAC
MIAQERKISAVFRLKPFSREEVTFREGLIRWQCLHPGR